MRFNNTIVLENTPSEKHNPYLPAALKIKTIKKIKNGKFVDFTELLPPTPTVGTLCKSPNPTYEQNGIGITIDPESQAISFKSATPKNKIFDFATWTYAWNNFYQTTLHFNPEMHYQLYAYFKLITECARKFKFINVLAYDHKYPHKVTLLQKADQSNGHS